MAPFAKEPDEISAALAKPVAPDAFVEAWHSTDSSRDIIYINLPRFQAFGENNGDIISS